ncbi:HD-GYP domain-containing protein [Deinococcus aestuarii]|uniref:HD-GYP domain-containing protein n=1 Tax=Deinococcus aestuarii TaxID=2774531 RepID=UPI001C0AD882|nr:HD domain-containing phosphohydrolase [Deinococcus aestuarii]
MFDDLDFFGAPAAPAPARPAPRPATPDPAALPGLRQLLLEAQPSALFLLDGAGLVLEVGGAWEAVTGVRPGEALGQPLHRWLRYDRARHPGALRVGQGVIEDLTLVTPLHTHVVRATWGARGEHVAGTLEPLAPAAQHAFRTAERLQDTERALDEAVNFLGVSQDAWQAEHIRRIVDFAGRLAEAAGLNPAEVGAVRWGAALHDIGKARVPQAILQKPGPLDPLEYEVILQHPVWGVQLLADLPFLPVQTVDAVRHHHERWDGQGYPLGLERGRIPLAARIVAVADVFDALTSARPYKTAWSYQDAVEHLIGEAGRHFDPGLTRLFVCDVLGFPHLADRFGDASTPLD